MSLPIAAVQAEGNPNSLAAIAGDLKAIRAIPLVAPFNRNAALVNTHRRRIAGIAVAAANGALQQADTLAWH